MAKTTGLGDALYIGGYDIGGDTQQLSSISGSVSPLDVTDITQSGHSRLGGLRDGHIDFAVYHDTAALAAHAALSGLPTADVVCTYFRGAALGNPAASCNGLQVNYDPSRDAAGNLTFTVSVQADHDGLEWGIQLTPGRRVDGTATAASSANSVDTTASAAFGGQAYVQLMAFAGTSVTISVWDSADNITFAAVTGFTTTALSSANQAARISIANNATIRRYVAVATVGTFTNADFTVQLSKNLTAGIVF